IFIPSIKTAIEYQGQQHYKPINAFGGSKTYKDYITRDSEKRELLAAQGVRLIEWKYDVEITEENLRNCIDSK
ncbi:MAG: hypothetical protein J5666_07170, partial [Bacilli bacterium]|nr:hypothetical protein [Bacilli bacterium]